MPQHAGGSVHASALIVFAACTPAECPPPFPGDERRHDEAGHRISPPSPERSIQAETSEQDR
jgi:hypothetical protein